MKNKNILFLILFVSLIGFTSCEEQLKEEVFSQLDPSTLFASANGIERVLYGAYGNAQIIGNLGNNVFWDEEWTTDVGWETGGGANRNATLMINFTWDASTPDHFTGMWNNMYQSIRNCNLVLENIDQSPVSESVKSRLIAEARFIRASAYYTLYTYFGTVPLRIRTDEEMELPRATEQELFTFLETELTEAAQDLPQKGELSGYAYGRATKGAAIGYLTKFFLTSKQWQKCADAAQQLMNLGTYELWPDYTTLFTVDNEEKNNEYIWVYAASPLGPGNEYMNGAFPPGFRTTVDGSIVWTTNMRNWARQDRLYDSFYNTFDPADERRKLIITEYINAGGNVVSLLNNDNTRAFKFLPDPEAVANDHGNDIPVIRYADILLARAEALNEISGPNQPAIDLINEVRNRAKVTPLNLSDFGSKEELRDHILAERGWEFYTEGKRRQDLIRHGKYISSAQDRGVANAQPYRVVFPIPQHEINANPACIQTDGY
ncbi:RagB/SusD family nutrient uptake outer membrane protein [Sunxiuqinia sp. A32]|uniref:RagB/SusD family nutrient uptake outer membrane protein n=1 Tax=Sunxiuqinia sp. A32 TaxID=3461496 RepID=UPI0040457255